MSSAPERIWNRASIQSKLMLAFLIPMTVILVMNAMMYYSVNSMINRIDAVYDSNVRLNRLADQLTVLQNSMREYLENKGTTALEAYYVADQDYRECVSDISGSLSGSMAIMQQNIVNQSYKYLQVVDDTVQAKRGRNVEKYKTGYEKTMVMYADLQNCIYSLNNEQFKTNTKNYYVLLSALRYMQIISIALLIFIGVVNILALYLLTRSMTRPLTELSHAADKVAGGDFDIELEYPQSEDEIGRVSRAFTKMVSSIQQYISEIRDSMRRESEMKESELTMQTRMREAELKSLQAQINPHFLFNTLNAGAQLAMMEGADKTTEFIRNMADFFRYNIKSIDKDVSLDEELSLVDNYIYILNVRFDGEIHYHKETDDTLGAIRVPSMILQPIVENAVNYGIRDIDWEGHITLKTYKAGDLVHISIADNGVGMTKDKIEKILSGTGLAADTEKNDSNGIGLGNVIERIRIFTGREDVMSIISEGENKGTEFIIKVPMHV
ncbi:MAG: histidine kinase [Lachnospiraceae bacterium]|nr:histidine kinase [Lachnospiraceae bacterium]